MRIEIIKNEREEKYVNGVMLDVGHTNRKYWGDPFNRDCFYGFVKYMEGREDVDFEFILRKRFLIQFLDIFYRNRTGYTDTDAWKTKDMHGDPLIGMGFGDTQYRIVFEERDISQMIDYLREKYATFYTPDRKGSGYINYHSLAKRRHEAAVPHMLDSDDFKTIKMLYKKLDTPLESVWRRHNGYEFAFPPVTRMLEHIKSQVSTKDELLEHLAECNEELRVENSNLKDLINQIHKESDI